MSTVDDIRSSLDIQQVAQLLGTTPDQAAVAVDQALNSLVGQLDANVNDAQGALNLTRALGSHAASDAYGDSVDLNAVDTQDGEKIIGHVYPAGDIQALGGVGGGLVKQLLPILAPIVLSYLAKQMFGQTSGGKSSGGILGDILGGLVGGSPQAQAPSSSGGLGDVLGDLLGGGGSGGGLGDLLGGLLGGATPAPAPAPTGRKQAPSPSGGGFRVPQAPDTGLAIDASGPAAAPAQGSPSTGDLLGGILSDLLQGRR